MYVKVTNGTAESYSIGKLRRDNPNTSFPKKISDATLADYDVYPVIASNPPEASSNMKIVMHDGFTQDANNNWVKNYVERDRFRDYTDEDGVVHTKAEQETAYQDELDDAPKKEVRAKRDRLLAETDWHGLSDVTMSAEMATYRQALRDITAHANFPNLEDADWPTKP